MRLRVGFITLAAIPIGGLEDIGIKLTEWFFPSPLATTASALVVIGLVGIPFVGSLDVSKEAKQIWWIGLAGLALGVLITVPAAYEEAKDRCTALYESSTTDGFGQVHLTVQYKADCLNAFGSDGP